MAGLILCIASFLASAGLLSVGLKKSSRSLKIIAMAIPVLLIGLRVDVGTDYSSYVRIYQQFSNMSFADLLATPRDGRIEVGFFGLIRLASLFTNDAWLMFLFSAILTIGVGYMAIKRLSPANIPLAFLLFLTIVVPFTTNGVRQGIAMSIVFFAYSYIIRGKPLKYIITILVASIFHMSALAILPLYLLRFIAVRKRIDADFTLLLSAMFAILFVLLIPLTLVISSNIPELGDYMQYVGRDAGIGRSTIVFMTAFTLLTIVSYRRLSFNMPSVQLMAALFFFEFGSLFLAGVSSVFLRMGYYLIIGRLVYISNIHSIFSGGTKRTVQLMTVTYALLYFTIFYYISGYSDFFPYKSIWGAKL